MAVLALNRPDWLVRMGIKGGRGPLSIGDECPALLHRIVGVVSEPQAAGENATWLASQPLALTQVAAAGGMAGAPSTAKRRWS